MKKLMLILLVTVAVNKASAQQDEPVSEERSSAWLKVSSGTAAVQRTRTSSPVKPKTAVTEKKADPKPAPPKSSTDPFNSTNNQVKRFKKKTNG